MAQASWRGVIPLLAVPALAFAAILWATAGGIGITPDSVGYIIAARAIDAGHGWTGPAADGRHVPITAVPPFFSYLLAAALGAGLDPLAFARFANAALLAGTVFLLGACVRAGTGSVATAVVVQSALVLSDAMLIVHTSAWTEPPFVFFTVAALALLVRSLETERRSLLMAAAILTALACLTRYAGLALAGTGMLAILFWGRGSFAIRVSHVLMMGTVSLVPVALVFLRNARLSAAATGREIAARSFDWAGFTQARRTVWSWLEPERIADWIYYAWAAAGIVFLLAAAVSLARRQPASPVRRGNLYVRVFALFAAVYLPFLLASRTFVDPSTPLDTRILAPALPSLLLIIAFGWRRALRRGHTFERALGALAVAALLAVAAIDAAAWARINRSGYWAGFGSREWRGAATIAWLAAEKPSVQVFTNSTEAAYMLGGKVSRSLPARLDESPRSTALRDALRDAGALIVFFRVAASDVTEAELIRAFPLEPVFESQDGVVYRWRP